MSYQYIYTSWLRNELVHKVRDTDYKIWQSENLQDLVTNIDKPIIEIGGPTQLGFYFLDGIQLNTKPIITNISSNPQPFSPDSAQLGKQVDEIFDATKMPYANDSVGICMMSAMSISSDWWVELPEDEIEIASTTFKAELLNAEFEMGQVAIGVLNPGSAKDAQRVKIYSEVARCLTKGGLFFTDSGGIEEIIILKQMGFELIACLQTKDEHGISYEFVAVKRF